MIIPEPVNWAVDIDKITPNRLNEHQNTNLVPLPSIALTCHYKNKEQTDVAIASLFKNCVDVKKLFVVDTSIEQNYVHADPRVKVLKLPNGLHSDGVAFGLKHLYRTQMSRKDRRVLLIDSDVEFTKEITKVPEGVLLGMIVDKRSRPEGTEDVNPTWLSILPRIHPCFCIINYGFLHEHGIPFMDWSRIDKDNMLILSHNPRQTVMDNPDFPSIRKAQKHPWYDVGSTMFEDVQKAGGKIVNFNWTGFMIHKGGGSWK